MKNYDETRQRLRSAEWSRSDRTGRDGIHQEIWWSPSGFPHSYEQACRRADIEPEPPVERRAPQPSYRRTKTLQIKHIDTKTVLTFIADFIRRTGHTWCTYYDLESEFPGYAEFPDHLWRAKMRKLLAKKLVNGCGCGCRGDWEITGAGYYFIRKERSRDDIKPGFNMSVDGRAVRDMWWEGTTMCVQFHDTGAIAKFYGAYVTKYSMEATTKPVEPLGKLDATRIEPFIRMNATVAHEPVIEFIPITFVIGEEPKK